MKKGTKFPKTFLVPPDKMFLSLSLSRNFNAAVVKVTLQRLTDDYLRFWSIHYFFGLINVAVIVKEEGKFRTKDRGEMNKGLVMVDKGVGPF